MRDGFVFYRSFYDSIKLLPKKYQFAFVQALCEYALNEALPESLPGGMMALFNALKPQIDANNRRYENGCKGGRPKRNQTETKPKPNDNQTETKAERKEKEKEKEKEQQKEKDKEQQQDSSGRGNCDDEFNIWKKLTPADIDTIYDAYPESGGDLIDEVAADVKAKRKVVKNAVTYILGYAKNVGWDDNEEHYSFAPWEAI